jgi:hypothetical protein
MVELSEGPFTDEGIADRLKSETALTGKKARESAARVKRREQEKGLPSFKDTRPSYHRASESFEHTGTERPDGNG